MRFLTTVIFVCALWSLPVLALDAPNAPPVLRVTGAISATNDGDGAVFDGDMMRALDWQEIETHTPFTQGMQKFAGPTLASLLAELGVSEGTIHATAVNDYTVEIPVSDAFQHGVVLALFHNDRPMRVRDKGPIWVVYPMDPAQAQAQQFASEMIWQLVRIHIVR